MIARTIKHKNSLVSCLPRVNFLSSNPGSKDTEKRYHELADKALEELAESLSELENDKDKKDIDISLSQGILTVNLGADYENKVWVINKQTPNRQIWWSSPLSGPRRYEIISDSDIRSKFSTYWRYSKDINSNLRTQMQQEIKKITGIDIKFED